jgi:hypothetical protein
VSTWNFILLGLGLAVVYVMGTGAWLFLHVARQADARMRR